MHLLSKIKDSKLKIQHSIIKICGSKCKNQILHSRFNNLHLSFKVLKLNIINLRFKCLNSVFMIPNSRCFSQDSRF